MLKKLLLVLCAGVLLALGSGCAVGMWTVDRTNDFIDMFGFRLTGNLGLGFEANARVTELFQTGGGWSEKYVVGFKGRDVGVYKEQSYTLPFIPSDWLPWIYPAPFGMERSVKREPLGGSFPEVDASRHVFWGAPSDVAFTKGREATKYDRGYDEVGFSVFALMVGVEAEVRLLEVLDFIVGMITFGIADPMQDDWLQQPKSPGKEKVPKRGKSP